MLTEPEVINVPGLLVKPRRFTVKLKYQGASFVSVPVEVSPVEAGNTDAADWTHSPALEMVGLPTSKPIPCMTIAWQVAQKLHAVTATLPDGRPNDRVHDLVDLQILEALIVNDPLAPVHHAWVEVFGARAQQARPPSVTVHEHWPLAYTQAASSVHGLALAPDVQEAAQRVAEFIRRIDAAHLECLRTTSSFSGPDVRCGANELQDRPSPGCVGRSAKPVALTGEILRIPKVSGTKIVTCVVPGHR